MSYFLLGQMLHFSSTHPVSIKPLPEDITDHKNVLYDLFFKDKKKSWTCIKAKIRVFSEYDNSYQQKWKNKSILETPIWLKNSSSLIPVFTVTTQSCALFFPSIVLSQFFNGNCMGKFSIKSIADDQQCHSTTLPFLKNRSPLEDRQ